MVLSFVLRNERMDEMEMPQVLHEYSFRASREVQAGSLSKSLEDVHRDPPLAMIMLVNLRANPSVCTYSLNMHFS